MSAGEKSMALRLVLDDAEGQSLADERIDAAVGAVLAALQAQLGARLRA
jgi:phenylalanyl-tRNA synthetase beta subunit